LERKTAFVHERSVLDVGGLVSVQKGDVNAYNSGAGIASAFGVVNKIVVRSGILICLCVISASSAPLRSSYL